MKRCPLQRSWVSFFAIVAVINDQQLFAPIINQALSLEGNAQIVSFYLANGILSVISDNVFVATVYINEVIAAYNQGVITVAQLDFIAVAINTGTKHPICWYAKWSGRLLVLADIVYRTTCSPLLHEDGDLGPAIHNRHDAHRPGHVHLGSGASIGCNERARSPNRPHSAICNREQRCRSRWRTLVCRIHPGLSCPIK